VTANDGRAVTARESRTPTRRSSGIKRREDILAAATGLFYAQGYADTSVEDIAKAVGVLKGSLYHYIDSKEDLLVRILEEVHEQVSEILAEVVARTDLSPVERLSLYVRRQVEYNARNVRKITVYYHDFKRLSGPRLANIRRQRRDHEQFLIDLLDEAVKCGEVHSELNTELAARATFATIIWPYTWYRSEGPISAQRLADFCGDFVLNGVRGQPVAPAPSRPRRKAAGRSG
jgi:TetR/AcrR family transcriptional regulator, cholesterol catabolism regulator